MSLVDDYQSEWAAHCVNECRSDTCLFCRNERINNLMDAISLRYNQPIVKLMAVVFMAGLDNAEEALELYRDKLAHERGTIQENIQ